MSLSRVLMALEWPIIRSSRLFVFLPEKNNLNTGAWDVR